MCGIDAHGLFQQVITTNPEQRKGLLEKTRFAKLPIHILNRMVKNPKAGLVSVFITSSGDDIFGHAFLVPQMKPCRTDFNPNQTGL